MGTNISSYNNINTANSYETSYQRTSNINNKVTGNTKKKAKKKRLPYHHNKMSIAIRQAKASGDATMTLAKARAALGDLLKRKDTGQYNEAEVENALKHARKMVECAKMKLEHLKQEEHHKYLNDKANHKSSGRSNKEALIQMEIKMREQALSQRCLENRGEEEKELTEADLIYMKNKIALLKKEAEENASAMAMEADCAVNIEAGNVADGFADIAADASVDTSVIDVCI